MRQHISSGRALLSARRSPQADQAFEAFEGQLDPPAQAVERQDLGGGKVLGGERGDQQHPVGGGQRGWRDLVPAPLRLPARPAAGRGGGLRRLLDGDQTQAESGLAWALEHPDRLIDQAALTMGVQRSNQIEGLTS